MNDRAAPPADRWRTVLDVLGELDVAHRHVDEPGPTDDWSLDADGLRLLEILVRRLRPRRVLEFGSGRSTCVLARACDAADTGARVVAIESDPYYRERTIAMLGHEGLESVARVVAAPLVARRRHGRYVPVYDIADEAVTGERADLVLVDGPPLPLGGREGSLRQAFAAARPGAIVVLDDARRESERSVLARALDEHSGSLEAVSVLGFAKGMALMVVTGEIVGQEAAHS